MKEGRETTKATTAMTVPHDESKTHIHGVPIVGTNIRDPFHIFNLQDRYFSIAAMGDTTRGDHNQIHHRAVSCLFSATL